MRTHARLFVLASLCALALFASPVFAQSATAADNGGSSVVTGGDVDGWAAHIVFKYKDGINQVDVARLTQWVDARRIVPFSVAFDRDPCETYQYDTVFGVNPAASYTMSDLGNVTLLASGILRPQSNCWNPPDAPPLPPPQCGPPMTFTFGGSPSIAKFEPDYPTPFLPEYLGPFYFYVPAGPRYRITSLTGDNHVGPGGKNDGPQNYEIGVFWFNNGTFVLPPTNDVPDDANSVLTDFGVHALTASLQTFYFLHAGPPGPPERANSFYPTLLTFTCVEEP